MEIVTPFPSQRARIAHTALEEHRGRAGRASREGGERGEGEGEGGLRGGEANAAGQNGMRNGENGRRTEDIQNGKAYSFPTGRYAY